MLTITPNNVIRETLQSGMMSNNQLITSWLANSNLCGKTVVKHSDQSLR